MPFVMRSDLSAKMTVFDAVGSSKTKVRTPLVGSAGLRLLHPSAATKGPKVAMNDPLLSANRVAAEPVPPLVTCLHDSSAGQGAIGWFAATSTASKVVGS